MTAMAESMSDTIDLLRRTPEFLRVLLSGLPEGWIGTPDVTSDSEPSPPRRTWIAAAATPPSAR